MKQCVGDRGKTRRPLLFAGSTVCRVWTVGMRVTAKRKLIYLQLRRDEGTRTSPASGRFCFYLAVLAGQNASWRGFNRTSCSGFDSPHILRSPPLIYNAFHSAFKQTVAFCISCSVPLDVVQQWIVLRAVLKSSRTRQSRLLNHYLLIHFTQPGVIMHGPVNGYLSMPRIYLIISRSGEKDKSTDCVHCEAFSAGGET